LRKSDIADLTIPFPSLSEQRELATLLDKANHLRLMRRYALQLCDELLPAAFVEMFGQLTTNELKWSFSQLQNNSAIASGIAKGQKYGNRTTIEVPYLRVANVQDGYLDLTEIKAIRALPEDVEVLRLQPGDIVMTEGGDFDKLGRGAIWTGGPKDCIHQNHIFRVRLDQSVLLPAFFASFLRSRFGKNYFLRCSKQTTNLASINMTQLRATPVPLPPLVLQNKFAKLVDRVQRLRAVHIEAIRQADHLFKTLLHQCFSER
jgi:type I restriction enzyme S subunit